MKKTFSSPVSCTPEEWTELLVPLSGNDFKTARYRANQICDWIFKKNVTDYRYMSNLSLELRSVLAERYPLYLPRVKKTMTSRDGSVKFLLELTDRNLIESVLIPEKEKLTLCLSSQAGCLRKCRYCATGSLGLRRNLTAGEIVSQILLALRHSPAKRLTNIVFMGMGEPLDNFDNVCLSIRLIQDERTLSFSPRRITLSTCGIIPGMRKLLAEKIKLKLAVSLNSAIQEKREFLMPVAKLYPIAELKKDLQLYRRNNPYRITLEYILFKGFNTDKEDARALIKLLGDLSCKVNLIAWNEIENNNDFEPPPQEEIDRFISFLQPLPFAVTYRKSRGKDINAACGQLAAINKNIS